MFWLDRSKNCFIHISFYKNEIKFGWTTSDFIVLKPFFSTLYFTFNSAVMYCLQIWSRSSLSDFTARNSIISKSIHFFISLYLSCHTLSLFVSQSDFVIIFSGKKLLQMLSYRSLFNFLNSPYPSCHILSFFMSPDPVSLFNDEFFSFRVQLASQISFFLILLVELDSQCWKLLLILLVESNQEVVQLASKK